MTITSLMAGAASLAGGAALLFAATGPALAATHPATPNNGEPQQQYQVKHDDKGNIKYCTKVPPITGSIITRTVCRTAADWKAEGVVINTQ